MAEAKQGGATIVAEDQAANVPNRQRIIVVSLYLIPIQISFGLIPTEPYFAL